MADKRTWDREVEFDEFHTIRLKRHDNELSVDFEVIEKADGGIVYEGSVKWDGCVNWTTGTECMAHFCRPEDIDEMRRVFIAIWNAAREMMPGSDYDAIPTPE